jgi:aspartokinase-like uncharacterized kinase
VTPWVVKLGGSVYNSPELSNWLDVIAGAGAGKIVLVPGGGPWADEVRAAQKVEGFDDRTAHQKALLAMEQYGHVLAGLRSDLAPASSVRAIREVLLIGKIAMWMPYAMVVNEPSIEESWDVTSDSLAAWLASRLQACGLLLIKSIQMDGPQHGIGELMRRGWVDPAFGRFASCLRVPIAVFGQGGQNAALELLARPADNTGLAVIS